MEERKKKWKLILGADSDEENKVPLEEEFVEMEAIMEALYDSDKQGGLGSSSPNVNRWLGDIRKYFPKSIVQVMQKDAMENLGMEELLLEPELLDSFEPDINLVNTILSLNKIIPEKTKETARLVVKKVVDEIEKKLKYPTKNAIYGALNKHNRRKRKKPKEIDWHRTILKNLKNYNKELKTIIPDVFIDFGKKGKALKHIVLLVDQSQSMNDSLVYSGVFGSILGSVQTIKTQLVVFDTAQLDLTELLHDPVELLFGAQLGGGTDIGGALNYVEKMISIPKETILFVISDLYEGASEYDMLKKFQAIKRSGVNVICLLALSDKGTPSYDESVAKKLANMSIKSFACSPDQFPALLEDAINNSDLSNWNLKNTKK